MYKILEDIEKTKVQKTKFLLRMLPISITCKVIHKFTFFLIMFCYIVFLFVSIQANIPSITSACKDLFDKHFTTEPTTFAIVFK